MQIKPWWLYQGTGKPHDAIQRLPAPPPWRRPRYEGAPLERPLALDGAADTFQASEEEINLVNTALYLRRPLLVTGKPGSGKSSLARAVAYELGLGEPLVWPISTRTTLADGLYRYDAIGRLQEAERQRRAGNNAPEPSITQFLRLGPLGTALAPWKYPRVLLIDEIDKSDIDLPNDLLHALEEGRFEIPELARLTREGVKVEVMASDSETPLPVTDGWVRCHAFPLIVLTSNGEREFPPAFLRRCIQLEVKEPPPDKLTAIVTAHLGPDAAKAADALIKQFLQRRSKETLATDQLLNAVYLATRGTGVERDLDALLDAVLKSLGASGAA